MGHSKGSPEREVHSNTGLPKKDRKNSNKQPNPTPTRTEQQQTKARVSRRKEKSKIRSELNDIKTKKTIQSINKSRSFFFEKTNKINKPLRRLMKTKGEKTKINTIRNKRGEITTDTTEMQRS